MNRGSDSLSGSVSPMDGPPEGVLDAPVIQSRVLPAGAAVNGDSPIRPRQLVFDSDSDSDSDTVLVSSPDVRRLQLEDSVGSEADIGNYPLPPIGDGMYGAAWDNVSTWSEVSDSDGEGDYSLGVWGVFERYGDYAVREYTAVSETLLFAQDNYTISVIHMEYGRLVFQAFFYASPDPPTVFWFL